MKIGVSGKGGSGKTMLAAFLARAFAQDGYSVLAVDADPNSNLAYALGMAHPENITPLAAMGDLVEERTGARPGQIAPYFKMNPRVDDLPDRYSIRDDGVKLMVMGSVKPSGSGCYCPEGALLQALVAHLLLRRDEVVILDMEAGIEHLTRGTTKGLDQFLVVVEPSQRSLLTARRVAELAAGIGVQRLAVVVNKVQSQNQRDFLAAELSDFEVLAWLLYDQDLADADMAGSPLVASSPRIMAEVAKVAAALEQAAETQG